MWAWVRAGEVGSPMLLLVPSEDIGTHYINNRMAQWRSWVSNIRAWTSIRSPPPSPLPSFRKHWLVPGNTKVKDCVIINCLIPQRLHCCAGGSPSLFYLGALQGNTHRQIGGWNSQMYTTAAGRGKVYTFSSRLSTKRLFFLCVFSPLLTKWQLPDDAAQSRFIFEFCQLFFFSHQGCRTFSIIIFSPTTVQKKAFR